jgi:hypothetical protein
MPGAFPRVFLLLPMFLLAACGHGNGAPPADDIPEGAIKVRDGYYMVPVGVDDDGCAMFSAYAPGMMTDQAIRFRRADGTFTVNKEEAACDGRN